MAGWMIGWEVEVEWCYMCSLDNNEWKYVYGYS